MHVDVLGTSQMCGGGVSDTAALMLRCRPLVGLG